MKTHNAEEKKNIAVDIFTRYPKSNKVAVTADGMAFIIDENELAVINHSKRNQHGKELEITRYLRDEVMPKDGGEKTTTTATAAQLIEKINASTTPEEVEEIKKAESDNKKRATVLAAADAKLAELNKK